MAMMAMTTKSSIKVNATARRLRRTEGSNWWLGLLEIISLNIISLDAMDNGFMSL
jgi:hypothetical protein